MNAFIDSNVVISYIFLLDPFNNKSNIISNKYNNFFWSNNVIIECEKVIIKKRDKLIFLLNEFKNFIINYDYEIDENICSKFIINNNFNIKEQKNFKKVLEIFWIEFVNNSLPSKDDVLNAIELGFLELSSCIFLRENKLNELLICVDKRIDTYDNLKELLISNGLHNEDIQIVLDAHDFNLKNNLILDFITFDIGCYDGTKKLISKFSFNNILGLSDFVF